MTRLQLALLSGIVAGAASPPPPHAALPVPPIPPAHPPVDQAAPLPDGDLRGPPLDSVQGARIGLTQFRKQNYDPSSGYAPGSRYQDSEDRRVIQTPGLTLKVPIQ